MTLFQDTEQEATRMTFNRQELNTDDSSLV
jgi:hypothetical protein